MLIWLDIAEQSGIPACSTMHLFYKGLPFGQSNFIYMAEVVHMKKNPSLLKGWNGHLSDHVKHLLEYGAR